eukprot:CAMPEP_0181099512 /NCGR_PEP_ID=MMETSP1071-20121207/12699_1 /TAXON_ID=35127 /ORGANISM="Thalassiosira sp., Strain NH16" /LENGTH=1053 /DNA_ID=CAMNT_0023182179 /DNA_START=19 /DNA_END=3180 /DNA_ORIENTATION=+
MAAGELSASTATPSLQAQQSGHQLDTLHGVYFPCLQSILGVILFLRLTHITSQAGCLFTSLLILVSSASTLFTWSSLSAIVTNGQIQGSSGPYYIISRTLGADIGCSLGLLYYIGNTLSCSMFVLGAAEAVQHSVRAYYARWGYGFSGHIFRWDVQLLAILLVVSMAGCVHVGTKYVTLFSNLFLCVTLTSILCVCMGCALFAMGLEEGNLQPYDRSFMENLWPRYEPDPYTGVVPNFFSCLALVYPCVTGMLAGTSKSLHLKNPSMSIPKGTFWAIMTCTFVYLTVCWLFGMTISNRTLKVDKFVTASVSYPHELVVRVGVIVSCLGLILGCMSTAPNLIAAMSSDNVLPFLAILRQDCEGDQPRKALWFTAILVALPTLGGNLDHVSPYATIFYLLMYAGLNAATCISGYVKPPGFRPTFRYFHWSVSFVGFVWCLGLSFCISVVGTFVSMLAFLLMHGYIKKARRLAKSGIRWGTLGNAVRYNIVSSALNSLAKSAASTSSFPTEVTLSMAEEGSTLTGIKKSPSFTSDGSVLSGSIDNNEEWVHFQPNSEFHAKNWRPQLLTIMDVDYHGAPTNLHVMSLAAQLQQMGKGINVVITIIDRSKAANAVSVASAINSICEEAKAREDASLSSDITGTSRWQNEEESRSSTTSGIDHADTIKLIQRSKGLLMFQMKREGMDGFAEVSTTDGKFFEAVWSAVIHTGLGPLSPNTILFSLPSFLAFEQSSPTNEIKDMECDGGSRRDSIAFEQDLIRAGEYLRTINGILNLGKAVILFKGCPTYPKHEAPLPERGTIDVWWIVHDGGLLLLLPFLLSKHAVWAGINDDIGTKRKSKNGFRRRKLPGAKLRLFAVTTTRAENPTKLHDAVVDHLQRVRIQAEVTVVDCLSGIGIDEYMRDWNSEKVAPRLDLKKGIVHDATSILKQNMGLPSRNHVASLRKDGISTHNMTLGEVFASKACEKPFVSEEEQANSSHTTDASLQNNGTSSPIDAASLFGDTIRRYSSDANLVVTNLPFIHKKQCAQAYFQFIERVCEGLDNVMFVRGSGAEVITAYA